MKKKNRIVSLVVFTIIVFGCICHFLFPSIYLKSHYNAKYSNGQRDNINGVSTNNDRPLAIHEAISQGDLEYIRNYFLCGGDTINRSDEMQKTYLDYAVEAGKPDVIKLLVELGADPLHGEDFLPKTPMQLAHTLKKESILPSVVCDEMITLLVQAENSTREYDRHILEYIKNRNDAGLKEILISGVFSFKISKSLSDYIAETKNYELYELFLHNPSHHGYRVFPNDIVGDDKCQWVRLNHRESIKNFLARVVMSIDSVNSNNFPARYDGSLSGIVYLFDLYERCEEPPDDNIPDFPERKDVTLLMLACKSGNYCLVQRLLELGADPKLMDRNGKTAFDYVGTAWPSEQEAEILQLLQAHIDSH